LYELKRAARACYDVAIAYGTPFISGKDSMFNDFKGYDENGPISVSIPPTLLGTAIGVMSDVARAISIDLKAVGDLLYLIGETNAELGGSEYTHMVGERENNRYGGHVPHVLLERNKKLYRAFAARPGLAASAISLGRGGLAVALAKSAMAGMLGADVDISKITGDAKSPTEKLFSESQGRILVSIAPQKQKEFETAMKGFATCIGKVSAHQKISFTLSGEFGSLDLRKALDGYRSTFKGY
jgi:phosphoribosylformylglycinamidine synthase